MRPPPPRARDTPRATGRRRPERPSWPAIDGPRTARRSCRVRRRRSSVWWPFSSWRRPRTRSFTRRTTDPTGSTSPSAASSARRLPWLAWLGRREYQHLRVEAILVEDHDQPFGVIEHLG